MKSTKILSIVAIVILIFILAGAGYYFIFYKNRATKPASAPVTTSETSAKQDDCKLSSRGQNTPYYHQIYSAASQDGLTWQKEGKMLFDHASVPGAVIKDGVVYLYFVDASAKSDQLSVAISKDLGKTFEKHQVLNTEMASCDMVDPHPELVDGKIRLYYLGNFTKAPELEQKGQLAFKMYSAESADGINFSGQKLAYAAKTATTDPDVFKTDKDWRMLVSQGKKLLLLTSADGLTFQEDEKFSWTEGGVCDTYDFNGTFRTYYCGQGLASAIGADKGVLVKESGTRIDEQEKITCDPSVIKLPDDSYLMYYKTQEMIQGGQAPAGQGQNGANQTAPSPANPLPR